MKKTYYTLVVCRFLFSCFIVQLARVQPAEAVNSFTEQMSLSSLLPLIATVYRNIPEAKNRLPDLNVTLATGQVWQSSGDSEPLEPESSYPPSAVEYVDTTGHCHEHWAIQGIITKIITPDIDSVDRENSLPASLTHKPDLPVPHNLTHLFAGNGFDTSDNNDPDAPEPLVPSEFPAVVRVSDIAEENWPQLTEADSLQNDTDSVRSVFRWANKLILNSLSDDPLLRFLTFIHGAAFYVQDTNGQPSYIIQHNGKLLFISRIEAYLWFSQYCQSFLESLYPEIFGPSLPAGGGWHEWKRFIRKKPFHPGQIVNHESPERDTNNHTGTQRPLRPEGESNERNERSTRSEAQEVMHQSECTPEHDTASRDRAGRQKRINQQKIAATGGGLSSGDGRLFSGDGRLLQVEYAGEAVGHGLCAVGVKSADTVVLAVEKRPLQLLQSQTNRKIVQLDEHAHLAFAGLSADARVLIRKAQLECQSFRLSFEDAMNINSIARRVAEVQQKATQHGGCRPYGVACIIGGFNNDGSPQLWQTEPSGVCVSWKACSVGRKSKAVLELLEREYKDDMSRDDTIKVALKGLLEAVESGARNIELMVLEPDHSSRRLALAELEQLVTVLNKERDEEAANKRRRDEQ
ncbi:archaeal proteasome endopeptidase complex subunit alpha [Endozoicomonas sp. SESOKO2]|uniref:archaeal proteasome endopeptidase complex subunit alpha n=2 Tax=unclassified Endozoicomonas TaxID=2644528 RepID=UPI0021483C03|nr:archaeal proteasome endopeptidase complex subunit alpha [Endozoicomonas sp. SESOKO2]